MTDSISTMSSQRELEDYAHLFEGRASPTTPSSAKTASPPLFSNIVLKTNHNANFDLNVLFNILPIIKISPEKIQETGKDFNEIFISVRKFPKSRGYRAASNIKSFLDMDFYFMDRNFHLKVSTHKISIVGGGSLEISKALVETVYLHLIALHNKWVSFASMPMETRNEICRIFEDGRGMDLSAFASSDGESYKGGDTMCLDFYEVLDSIIDRDNEDVHERLCDLNPIIGKPLFEQPPVFTKLVNCNSVHNYHLPEPLCLVEVANKLHHKGYEVKYHNAIILKCFKAYWVDPENGNKFGFSIQNIGTIKQNSSCSFEDSQAMYEKIVRDIGYEPYQKGKEYAVKQSPRPTEVVVKNERCLAILDRYLGAGEEDFSGGD